MHAAVRGLAAASPRAAAPTRRSRSARAAATREPSSEAPRCPGAGVGVERRVCEDVAVRPAAPPGSSARSRRTRAATTCAAAPANGGAPRARRELCSPWASASGSCGAAAPDAHRAPRSTAAGRRRGAAARRARGGALGGARARGRRGAREPTPTAAKVMRAATREAARHVLAAGNAVNAGNGKGGASAVKLASLRGADAGRRRLTTLLDGVVGLISTAPSAGAGARTRAGPRGAPAAFTADDGDGGRHRRHAGAAGGRRRRPRSSPRRCGTRTPTTCWTPERDGILAAPRRRAARAEHAIQGLVQGQGPRGSGARRARRRASSRPSTPARRCRRASPRGSRLPGDARAATADECPRAWPASTRDAERRRLLELHERARRQCLATETQALAPLLVQAREIRTYFACGAREPLDSIYATLRDFLRALCESRDAQRRARRARRREADRRAAARARGGRRPTSGRRSADAARRRAAHLSTAAAATPARGRPPERRPRPGEGAPPARGRRRRRRRRRRGPPRPARLGLGRRLSPSPPGGGA